MRVKGKNRRMVMMEKEKMIELRNLFYKMALIGFAMFFVGIIFCAAFPAFLTAYSRFLFGTGDISLAVLILMGVFESLIITLFLIPALALHWQINCKKK